MMVILWSHRDFSRSYCGKDFSKVFVAREIQYFELGIFSFNSYVYFLTRGFITSSHAFNLLTRAFNLRNYAFSLPTRAFNLATLAFNVLTREFEYLPKEIRNFINNKNITKNIYRVQVYDSIVCD